MAQPSISIREWIRWLPEPASEPTTTLVLTSPGKRFVDVRILRHTDASSSSKPDEDVLPQSRLDWGFAGTSESESKTGPDGKEFTHSKWHHWVSSHVVDAEKVTDEGDMFMQPDGKVLETGKMVNPATGKATEYEELWSDPGPIPVSSKEGDEGPDGIVYCCVLLLQNDEHKERGMVVRVGQFCQGILRSGDAITVERWEWKKTNGWQRVKRIGDAFLPCGAAMDGPEKGRLQMGGEVKYLQHVWKVVEMSEH